MECGKMGTLIKQWMSKTCLVWRSQHMILLDGLVTTAALRPLHSAPAWCLQALNDCPPDQAQTLAIYCHPTLSLYQHKHTVRNSLKINTMHSIRQNIQESLANAKVSTQQPWYIGRNSLNRPPLRITRQHQRNLYIVKKYFQCATIPRCQCRSIFISLAIVASQTCQLAQNSVKIWTYSSSRSSKVNDFGTNRKGICDFWLVITSNLSPILHRFWDTTTYWLKIAYFSYPFLIWRPRSLISLCNFTARLSVRKLESWGYSVAKVAWS